GRCFMESLNVPMGRFLITNVEFWKNGSVPFVPTDVFMRKHHIGNGAIDYAPNVTEEVVMHRYGGRLKFLRQFLNETGCAVPGLRKLARQYIDFNCPGDGVLGSIIEQEPNRDSRVTLADDIDSLGLRRVQLNWQFCTNDLQTIRTMSVELAKEMAR